MLGRLLRRGKRRRVELQASTRGDVDAAQDVEARLLGILGMVNDWLHFAEAKNAGVVALAAVGASAILTYLAGESDVPDLLFTGLLVTTLLLALALAVALRSFLPRTDPVKLMPKGTKADQSTDNLYFYGDLRRYRPEQLAEAVARTYGGWRDYDAARFRSHTDLGRQIVVNSQITHVKNEHFRVATWFVLASLGSAVLFAALTLILCR